ELRRSRSPLLTMCSSRGAFDANEPVGVREAARGDAAAERGVREGRLGGFPLRAIEAVPANRPCVHWPKRRRRERNCSATLLSRPNVSCGNSSSTKNSSL